MSKHRFGNAAVNEITGELLQTKVSTKAYMDNLEIIQQNNAKNSIYTCEDCATIPCVFPERGTRCSYFELKERDFSDSHPIPEHVRNALELTEDQMKQFEDTLQELHKINCEIFLPSELLKTE